MLMKIFPGVTADEFLAAKAMLDKHYWEQPQQETREPLCCKSALIVEANPEEVFIEQTLEAVYGQIFTVAQQVWDVLEPPLRKRLEHLCRSGVPKNQDVIVRDLVSQANMDFMKKWRHTM